METTELLSLLRYLDIRLWLHDGRLRYSAPEGAVTAELRAQVVAHKAEIISLLRQAETAVAHTALAIEPVPRDETLPLSFAQQRLWLLDKLMPGIASYNIFQAVRLQGPFNINALEQTLNEIVRRHELLRTTFPTVDGRPVQVIAPTPRLNLLLVDLQALSETEHEAEIRRLVKVEAERPFDLARGPLLRVTLLRLNQKEHGLLFTMHHIVSDGWSMGVLVREVATLYQAFSEGRPSPLPELPIQYADYAYWQRQWLQGEVLAAQLAYWKEQLAGAPTILQLPFDRPRPAVQTFRGAHHAWTLPRLLSDSLKVLSRQEGVTLFMTLLAAFATLLYRYTGQEDILVGSPIAGRNRAELEDLIGFFVNILVLRTDLSGNPGFKALLRRVREVILGAYAHQELPFEKILEELQPQRDLSHTPLVQAAFAFQNVPLSTLELPDLTLSPLGAESPVAKIELVLFMSEGPMGLQGLFEYNTDLFEAPTIARMADHFQTLLAGVVADPEQRLSMLPPRQLLPSIPGLQTQLDKFDDLYERSNLTRNQLLIWVGQKLQPDVPLYNMVHTFTIPREIDPEHFRTAFQTLINSSDALRTVIQEIDGVPQQQVLSDIPYQMEYLDFSKVPDPDTTRHSWLRRRSHIPFDFEKCLFDSVLIKMSDSEYFWYLCIHHILADNWAHSLIFRRMSEFYERSLKNQLAQRLELPAFRDYLAHERAYRTSSQYPKAKAYWNSKLAEDLEPVNFYSKTSLKRTTRLQTLYYDLGFERTKRLREIAIQEEFFTKTVNVSLFNIFAALLCTFLYRISGNRRLSFGTPFHNRHSQAFKETIGLLMVVVPLRITIDRNDTFVSLVKKVVVEAVETYQHRHYAIVNPSDRKAYDVLFNYINTSYPDFAGVPVQAKWVHSGHENESLALEVFDYALSGSFVLQFDFNCDVFTAGQRELAVQHFLQVLDAFLEDSCQSVADVSLLTTAERRHFAAGFNTGKGVFPENHTIPELYEERARITPDKVAAVYHDRAITFRELDEQASNLANLIMRLKQSKQNGTL